MSDVKVSAARLMEAVSIVVATSKRLPDNAYHTQLADYFITQIANQLSDEQITEERIKVKDNLKWMTN